MNKKSIMLKVATIVMMGTTAVAVGVTAGCSKKDKHNWSEKWSSDSTNHWHACLDEDCTEKNDEAAHVDADKNGKCDVCEYVLKVSGGEEENPGGGEEENPGGGEEENPGGGEEENPGGGEEENPPVTEISEAAKAFKADVAAIGDIEEATIASVEEAIEAAETKYATLSETDKADETVTASKTALDNKKAALETLVNEVKASVKAIKDKVDALDATREVSLEYDTELKAILEDIEELGAYGSTLWLEADTEKVNAEITRIKTTVYASDSDIEVFVNGANGNINIIYEATNVFGEVLMGNAPELTITVDAGANVDTSAAEFTENEGLCIYKVNFVKKGGDAETEAGYQLKVEYTIGNGEKQTVVYKEIKDDAYINTTDCIIIKEDKIQFAGAPKDAAYLDIYETKYISIGEDNKSDPVISGFPLVKKVPVENGMTVEELRRQLAREYGELLIGEEYEVRFVMYKMTVEENGDITMSNIKNSLVSHDTYTLDLTDYDAKFAMEDKNVFDLGVWPGSGNFSLITVNQVPNFVSQFAELYPDLVTADNASDYFQIAISAYEYDEENNAKSTPSFVKVVPFQNQAYDYSSFMKEWASKYFKDGGEDNGNVKFYLTLTIQLKETVNGERNPLAKDFRDSASKNVTVQNDYTGTYTFTKTDVTLPTDIQMARSNEPIFLQGFKISNEIINGHVSSVEIHFTTDADKQEYNTVYILYDKESETFALHTKADGSDTGLELIKGGSEYYKSLNDVNIWFGKNFNKDGSIYNIYAEGLFFRTKIVDNANDDTYLFGNGESEWETFYQAPAATE